MLLHGMTSYLFRLKKRFMGHKEKQKMPEIPGSLITVQTDVWKYFVTIVLYHGPSKAEGVLYLQGSKPRP
jgi:hypothetical protein